MSQVKYSSKKKFKGSKPQEFYSESYFLNANGSNYGRKTADGTMLFSPYNEQSYLPRNRQLATLINNVYHPKNLMVLGCARAYLVKAFRELGVEAYGMDISEWAIENAPHEVREYLYVGDICDLSMWKDSEFDVVVALDVLEHVRVPDLYTAIKETARITKTALLIDTPAAKDDLHPDQSDGTDKSHVSVYTPEWWVCHFEKEGLKAVQKHVYLYPEGARGATIYFLKSQPKPKAETEDKTVDIIIPNYNGIKFLPKCVESLYRNATYPFNLIIVDNCSTDGSDEYLNFIKMSYPNLTVHFCDALETGFAEAVNISLKYAKSSYVVLLNNDVLITQKDWLQKLLECFTEDTAIVTPKLLYPDGRIQYAGATFTPEAMPYHMGRFRNASEYTEKREIPTATFACAVIRRELLKDGLDESYLMGTFEDTDFCVKQRFNGWKILYCPSVVLYHYEGATVLGLPREHYMAQQRENARLFMERWASWVKEDMQQNMEVYKE